ncbi:hypothetical protein ACOSP7_021384 [Xanthoceras sorbifolium]
MTKDMDFVLERKFKIKKQKKKTLCLKIDGRVFLFNNAKGFSLQQSTDNNSQLDNLWLNHKLTGSHKPNQVLEKLPSYLAVAGFGSLPLVDRTAASFSLLFSFSLLLSFLFKFAPSLVTGLCPLSPAIFSLLISPRYKF